MFLRVAVDVGDQVAKVRVRRYEDAAKGILEKTAGALVRFVDRLGVGVEQIKTLKVSEDL